MGVLTLLVGRPDCACIIPWNMMLIIALNVASGSDATRTGSNVAGLVAEGIVTSGLRADRLGTS